MTSLYASLEKGRPYILEERAWSLGRPTPRLPEYYRITARLAPAPP
jgi:hypothetical protein